MVRAGAGFLEGAARDGLHLVRLELHDGPPPDDRADWLDAVETPYLCQTGAVGLTNVTGGTAQPSLALDGPGRYAVRVTRRAYGSDGWDDEWCLRFWPDAAGSTVDMPRWLARSRPATPPGDHGWTRVLGVFAGNLMGAVREAVPADAPGAEVTVAQIDASGRRYSGVGWLDGPLATEPAGPLRTGHADLDERAERTHREALAHIAAETAELDSIASQLGVPAPRRVRDLLPLLVAAELLTVEDSGVAARYRLGQPTRPALEVLRLPPQRVRVLSRQDAQGRYTSFATDMASLAVWAADSPVVSTVDDLAARLLARPGEVRAALWYAADLGQLVVEDGDDTGTGPVRFALPAKGGATRPTTTSAKQSATIKALLAQAQAQARSRGSGPAPGSGVSVTMSAPSGAPSPGKLGAPPRAGYLTHDGDLVVWRDSEPVTLLAGEGQRPDARETAYGVALLSSSGCRHVREDGTVEEFGTNLARGVVSEDGRYLAFAESSYARRSWHRAHVVDLADSSRRTMPWDERDDLSVIAMHGGCVQLLARSGPLRWIPGTDPERSPVGLREIDPLSGTALRQDDRELVVTGADGTARRIPMYLSARLAPGGTRLYTLRDAPPAVTLFDIERGAVDPIVHWLPRDARARHPELYWEDEHHLLVLRAPDLRGGPRGFRLDVRTGASEGVPLTEAAGYYPALVKPLLRA